MSNSSRPSLRSYFIHLARLVYTRAYAACWGIEIGKGSIIHPGARLRRHSGGRIRLGKRNEIAPGAVVMTYGGDISFGDDCSVQPYCVIYGHGGFKAGSGVRMAAHCVVIPANHRFDDLTRPIFQQGIKAEGIEVGDDVWIAAGARILDGVKIGSGSVVAAGAVVTRSVPSLAVVGGVPASVIGRRGRDMDDGHCLP